MKAIARFENGRIIKGEVDEIKNMVVTLTNIEIDGIEIIGDYNYNIRILDTKEFILE